MTRPGVGDGLGATLITTNHFLELAIAAVSYFGLTEGAVAACGLAGGVDLPGTVMPFILRGVKLLGINSVTASAQRRDKAWARLAKDLDKAKLDSMTVVEPLSNIEALAAQILRGETRGRIVIDVKR